METVTAKANASVNPNAADKADEVDGSRIKSVALTITLLNEIAAAGGPMRVSDLARRVGEAKGRIHRHLLTLRDAGILVQSGGDERYRLGWKLFELGQAAVKQFDIGEIAGPALRKLRDETRLTVLLGLRDGDQVIISHSIDSVFDIAVTVRKGQRLPAHGSAMGRVMLAFASPEDQRRILSKPLTGTSPRTMTDRDTIVKRLAQVRERLYDVSEGESQHGVTVLSAPILDAAGHLVAIAAIIGTQQQVSTPISPVLLDPLVRCVNSISAALSIQNTPVAAPVAKAVAGTKRRANCIKP